MDRPMRRNGPSVYDLVLAEAATVLGFVVLAWAVLSVIFRHTLLPADTAASGLLSGAAVAAALCLIMGGGGVRRYLPVLELGLLLLTAIGLALVVAGVVDGRPGATGSGAALLALRSGIARLASLANRLGYRPLWFSPRSFRTMVATVETMLDADGREAIPPQRTAINADRLLAAVDAPAGRLIRVLFIGLEWVMPLVVILRPLPFSALGAEARRQLVERLIEPSGPLASLTSTPFRSVARTLKVLTCAGYYGDPVAMRSIGFVEFEGGPRSKGVDLTPKRYCDPNPPRPSIRTSERVDAVIVGSGASGSVMAYELACRGLSVVVVERGRHEDPLTFEHSELEMFPRLYKYGGLQTASDNNTAIFQGSTVGGSTVINNAIWLRPDLPRVLGEWSALGAHVPQGRLEAAYQELEAALRVEPIDLTVANPGTGLFLRGAGKTGVVLSNNRDTCVGCGWCNYGCRYNRKTSMLVTYIPWAQDRGVVIRDCVSDLRIRSNGGRALGIEGRRDGKRVAYDAEKVVVCAGAIGSSTVLLQSDIKARGNVGKRFHVLGGLFVTGDMGEVVDGFDGIGLTCMDTGRHDYVLESYFAPPLAFSVRLGGWLLSHFDRAERYRHFIDGGVMVGTDPACSTITLSRNTPSINLRPSAADIELLKQGLKQMAKIYFDAGARRVYPSTFKYIDLMPATYECVIEEKIKSIDDVFFGSAHPQGGNAMNRDPKLGVVGEDFQVHDVKGLYVADTSVWPSNIRANCQATAMAMAHYAAEHVGT